jgi:lipopolysaccharide transport system permease protein
MQQAPARRAAPPEFQGQERARAELTQESAPARARLRVNQRRLSYICDLLLVLVSRDIKLRYHRSVLGIFWSLLIPLAQVLVFYAVFRSVLAVHVNNYYLFVFCGLLAWGWFHSSLTSAAVAITDNRQLIRRPGFPVGLLPAIPLITYLVHFFLAVPVLLVFLVLGGGRLSGAVVLLPVVVAVQLGFTLSLAYLVAALQVTFRDTQHLVGVALLLLFYLSPVIYPADAVPDAYRWLYGLNPMVQLLEAYRRVLLDGEVPEPFGLFWLSVASAALLWLGHRVFMRASYSFAEEL